VPKPKASVIELIPHTADIGIEVWAESLDELFVTAAKGFTKVLVTNPSAIRPRRSVEIELGGTDLTDLLVRWLSELLYLFDVERILFSQYKVHVDATGLCLKARLKGEQYDPARHHAGREVKAVTYHEALVEQVDPGRWHARVIFDI
jgi:SHS2 domain-containing protein